MTIHKNSGIGT